MEAFPEGSLRLNSEDLFEAPVLFNTTCELFAEGMSIAKVVLQHKAIPFLLQCPFSFFWERANVLKWLLW